MEEKDKIYDMFRRNEHKLTQRPSRRAWERLENRLDMHETPVRSYNWARYGGMVAAVMVLVLTASLLIINNNTTDKAQFAMNGDAVLLDLPEAENASKYYKIVEYQVNYKTDFAANFSEGESGRSLAKRGGESISELKESVDGDMESSSFTYTWVDIKDSRTSFEFDALSDVRMDGVTVGNTTNANITMDNAAGDVGFLPVEDYISDMEEMVKKPEGEGPIAEAELKSAPQAPVIKPEIVAPVKSTSMEKESLEEVEMPAPAPAPGRSMAAEESKTYEFEGADDDYMDAVTESVADVYREQVSLDEFEWLLGTWKENLGEGDVSNEKWNRMDANTIVGHGWLSQNNEKVFSEDMTISSSDGEVYLFITLEEGSKPTRYKMVKRGRKKVTFRNNEVSFPKEIVFFHTSDKEFSTIMQNSSDDNLESQEQVDYMSNRNQLLNRKMIRNLVRVK